LLKKIPISHVCVLYNPVSTSNSKGNALDLAKRLRRSSKSLKVSIKKTEYAGHGEAIAKYYAERKDVVLLVSSSGDGGYNDLINGVLKTSAKNIITAVVPSGNANDHHRAVGSGKLVENIITDKRRRIDALKITTKVENKTWIRFAHSYAGVGISPVVGRELTRKKLNFFNEKWLFLKHVFSYRYVTIRVNGKKVKYISLVFGNVDKMSKMIKFSKNSSLTDGKFEVSAFRYTSKWLFLSKLFMAATVGAEETKSVSSFEFRTIKKTLIQLDGEDFTLDANSDVKVESMHNALTIIA
jgi:diacylglycerol kinase (ATP)